MRLRGNMGDLLVAACAAALVARAAVRAASAGPGSVDLVPAEISLGTVPEGVERLATFTVSNRSPEPLRVVIVPSCACTTAERGVVTIAGRSNVVVPVRVSTARRPGYNVAHVQIATPEGRPMGQARISFTAVRALVVDPPVLFLRGGEDRALATAFALGRSAPAALVATSEDSALAVTVKRTRSRTWEISASLSGRPRSALTSIRIAEVRDGGHETLGVVAVGMPASRIGDVRMSPDAEPLAGGRARAWMLFDTEASCAVRVASLRAVTGREPAWRTEGGVTRLGSHLWLELSYPRSERPVVELVVEAGAVRERMTASLPAADGT
jgi:hypothetical protein